jgi:hypothetical protein
MRICLIARNRFHSDRKALATYRALKRGGHDVVVVAVDSSAPKDPVAGTVTAKLGEGRPLLRQLNRILPLNLKSRILSRRLASAAVALDADIYVPLQGEVLPGATAAARRAGGVVQRMPGMADAGSVDLIELAPSKPELAAPTQGYGARFTPADSPAPYEPQPDRHAGERAVICYRKTAANPGRYLESALRRSGMEVRVETESIDLATVDPCTKFVVFVEGPYPAIGVKGTTDVPTLYWAHHGEHHLFANLRLTDLYRADAVLLAHSWHLAHWFPAPVHRFPFAVPAEVFASPPKPLAQRRFDVAMVGSKLRADAWQYQRRRSLVADLESRLPRDRVRFVEGLTPEEMAVLYGDSRIVLNEGGVRHYPITMRVFEAIGVGAVLLTDAPPGLDLLFEPGQEYRVLTDDVVADVARLLGELEVSQAMTDRATERAAGLHTYDHRVDMLVTIADETAKRDVPPPMAKTDLARMIDADVEVQRLVHDGVAGLEDELPDREVWPLSERAGRLRSGSMDAAVITSGDVDGKKPLIDSARRFIYTDGEVAGLTAYVAERHPNAVSERDGRLKRIDLMTEAYRVKSAGSI